MKNIEQFLNKTNLSEKNFENLAHKISKTLNLRFTLENSPGRVCFAENNQELRDEFKQVFNTEDLMHFIAGQIGNTDSSEKTIEIPKDAEDFWYYVRKGRRIVKPSQGLD